MLTSIDKITQLLPQVSESVLQEIWMILNNAANKGESLKSKTTLDIAGCCTSSRCANSACDKPSFSSRCLSVLSYSRIWLALAAIDACRSGGNAFSSSARVVYFRINFPPQVSPDILRSLGFTFAQPNLQICRD